MMSSRTSTRYNLIAVFQNSLRDLVILTIYIHLHYIHKSWRTIVKMEAATVKVLKYWSVSTNTISQTSLNIIQLDCH